MAFFTKSHIISEETLEKSRQRGSKMKIFLEYTSLPVVNITEDTTNENFQENYNKIKEHNIETNEGRYQQW